MTNQTYLQTIVSFGNIVKGTQYQMRYARRLSNVIVYLLLLHHNHFPTLSVHEIQDLLLVVSPL